MNTTIVVLETLKGPVSFDVINRAKEYDGDVSHAWAYVLTPTGPSIPAEKKSANGDLGHVIDKVIEDAKNNHRVECRRRLAPNSVDGGR